MPSRPEPLEDARALFALCQSRASSSSLEIARQIAGLLDSHSAILNVNSGAHEKLAEGKRLIDCDCPDWAIFLMVGAIANYMISKPIDGRAVATIHLSKMGVEATHEASSEASALAGAFALAVIKRSEILLH